MNNWKAADNTLACVTWNVHRARGADGRVDAPRVVSAIERIIAPLGPDVLALQEADDECPPHARILDADRISRAVGLSYMHDSRALRWGPQSDGFLGTVLWVHPRFERTHADVIDLPGHCHRGAISAECLDGDRAFRVMSVHLSLAQPLRMVQTRIIGQYLLRRPAMQTVILGDLNEWRPWGGAALGRVMLGRNFYGPVKPTFPARWPILPLDRILTDRRDAVQRVNVLDHPMTTAASDHRPLAAHVSLTTS
ncbi:endonuclease/exonuclease/phosphatase family protein [Sedimentitalea todarodis]|uniref:Endonuclease/exonuclease/phosphatase family protein n=1 Tax=Sedimentitalea todarodis TaxID=1631240 RepID=A0ABU3VDV8_9RHOB|nr:endonuclease/exonuclease/phosphatase family protein [Sedimentitalea todarodis]MDU9004369.1 endonuclease/exonuclease/phosphatase family protein [Sedimentitalea todarodis]